MRLPTEKEMKEVWIFLTGLAWAVALAAAIIGLVLGYWKYSIIMFCLGMANFTMYRYWLNKK